MIRRIVIGALALCLAVAGGVLTYLYAAGADARAMAEMAPARVLVVAAPIAAGTPAEGLGESLAVQEIPTAAVVPGALTSMDGLAGQVVTADLVPGEQLLAARFAAPDALPGAVEVPAGMHQLAIQLEPRRVIGGNIRPGDRVGVFVSRNDAAETHLILHKVLVVAVRGAAGATSVDEEGNEVEQGPAETITVTLALTAPDAELVVFASEYERIYLSLEASDATEAGTRIVDSTVILQ